RPRRRFAYARQVLMCPMPEPLMLNSTTHGSEEASRSVNQELPHIEALLEPYRQRQRRQIAVAPGKIATLALGIPLGRRGQGRHVLDEPPQPREECEIRDVRDQHR